MSKVRAYGADATLKPCREITYGVAPASGYRSLDFKSTDLSSEQPLGVDPLLGRGRNAQDPYRGLITDEGAVDIPLDLRCTGFWLTGLFGDPTTTQTRAAGHVAFADQPAANSSIVLNGVTWTFGGTPSGSQTQIGASLDATLTALAADLNLSADSGEMHLHGQRRPRPAGGAIRYGRRRRQRFHPVGLGQQQRHDLRADGNRRWLQARLEQRRRCPVRLE